MSLSVKGVKKEDLRLVAEELGNVLDRDFKILELKEIIIKSEEFINDPDFVQEILASMITERKEREELERTQAELAKTKLEHEEREKERIHELELARINSINIQSNTNQSSTAITNQRGIESDRSIENLIKSVKTLTLPVPSKPEYWNLFFSSIERAFQTKNVPEELKAEILINLLGEKAANILIYVGENDLSNYENIKKLALREFELSAQICCENFRKAKRDSNETHVQFASRLVSSWEYYCKLRKVTDFETLKQLIVSDKLLQTLDSDTAAHISIRQGEDWFKPIDMAKECDLYFRSKGKSLSETKNNFQNSSDTGTKYVPPPMRRDGYKSELNQGIKRKECFICKSTEHIAKFCSQRIENSPTKSQSADQHQVNRRNDEVIVARVRTKYFESKREHNSNSKFDIQSLQYVTININGREVKAILDSGTQIPVLHPADVPNVYEEDCGTITLTSAFGEETIAKIIKIPMAVKDQKNGNLLAPVEVMGALTNKLRGPCLIPPETYKMLQEKSPEKVSDRAPITPVLRPELPFKVVNIDVIGQIKTPSGRGHKYVLCLMDQLFRWPETVPMRSLSAKSACEVLLQIFMRTGISYIVSSDQRTNFTSSLTQEFSKLKRIGESPRFSFPRYASSNGLVERRNRVLQQMLHHTIRDDTRNWDRHLPFLPFAYREVPNCTGVSPFRLLYAEEAQWTSPDETVQLCPFHSYKIKLPVGYSEKIHVNKIRKYHPRVIAVRVVFDCEEELGEIQSTPRSSENANVEEVISCLHLNRLTDNPATFLTKGAPQSSRLQRWAFALQMYDIEVKHCPVAQLNYAGAHPRLF